MKTLQELAGVKEPKLLGIDENVPWHLMGVKTKEDVKLPNNSPNDPFPTDTPTKNPFIVHVDLHYPVLSELRKLKADWGHRSYSATIWKLMKLEKERRKEISEKVKEFEMEHNTNKTS